MHQFKVFESGCECMKPSLVILNNFLTFSKRMLGWPRVKTQMIPHKLMIPQSRQNSNRQCKAAAGIFNFVKTFLWLLYYL